MSALNKIKSKTKGLIASLFRTVKRIYEESEWERLKKQFASIDEDSHIASPYYIANPQCITIGKNFKALYNVRIEAVIEYPYVKGGQHFNPEITIGNHVIMNSDIHIACINNIQIGNNVLFASRIFITDHSHGEVTTEALKTKPINRPLVSKGPVIIGNNIWIGEGVSILGGVEIGDNCIIGTNAVVTKSFPANSVIAGNPAKLIRTL